MVQTRAYIVNRRYIGDRSHANADQTIAGPVDTPPPSIEIYVSVMQYGPDLGAAPQC